MSNIITIAYFTEGRTDKRFLESIIKLTFDKVAFDCEAEIEVFDPINLRVPVKNTFVKDMTWLSKEAFNRGINVLCIHVDADAENDKDVITYKIKPTISSLKTIEDTACKNIVFIVPVRMSEAWMLADKELLKEEIGTLKSDNELKIARDPESIANPKEVIEEALRIAQEDFPGKRKKVVISELYQPIGQQISLEKLENLPSFKKFKKSVENAFRTLNYLH